MSSSLLHAVANHTNIIGGRATILELLRPADPEVARTVAETRAQLDALSALGERMRAFAAGATAARGRARLCNELELACAELDALARTREVVLRLPTSETDHDLDVPSVALHAVCHGLLGFAVHAARPKSVVSVETSRVDAELSLSVGVQCEHELPKTRRELVAPWLVGEVDDCEARLLLALALGTAQARGYRFDATENDRRGSVAIHLPLARGAP